MSSHPESPRAALPLRAGTAAPALDADDVRAAYRRWAGVYDVVFGGVSAIGRRRAVAWPIACPAARVLEVGVGTGLALPHYLPEKRITGIDLSAEMLAQARKARRELGSSPTSRRCDEMDAEATDFADAWFDIAVAMFVASVVPNPRGCWRRCAGWSDPAATSCSSITSPPRRARAGGSNARWRRPRAHWAGTRTSRWTRCCRRRTRCAQRRPHAAVRHFYPVRLRN